MTFLAADRCAEYTTTLGTGTLALGGRVAGYQTFISGVADGREIEYCILSGDADSWEVGRGLVTAGSPATLTRNPQASSSGGGLINLSGRSTVFLTAGARFLTNNITQTKTANYAIVAAESGARFNNIGAAGSIDLTLPAAADGLKFAFLVRTAQQIRVIAQAGERIAVGPTNSALAGNAASSTPFAFLELESHETAQWVASGLVGSWTVT